MTHFLWCCALKLFIYRICLVYCPPTIRVSIDVVCNAASGIEVRLPNRRLYLTSYRLTCPSTSDSLTSLTNEKQCRRAI
ncbi:uncharacterized protein GGS22DRAFT_34038 [Annulohypoxylon maeteangense]|uniref:uncharacterized protein n=1 Tax=Annulohypoxylon maeteangense TaxID=1927788 RepID=UPI0020089C31|nr:uncharacterized protein GGS22DRAFT_34038 [Annulohypoxylon maeteangense]KAI0883645.1 hypothetical protein GGS22DRAFT_34038 [Annulohypoxylon maeteangense]